jgi:hypothetical protein
MKLTVVLAVLFGILMVACSSAAHAPAELTPNLEATAEAKATELAPTQQPSTSIPNQDSTGLVCKLMGGEEVQNGWSGQDSGANSCNSCFCTNGVLGCTKMACPPKLSHPN